jgi:hypothetical protein
VLTVRATACRCAAAFASLLAACALAACTTTVDGTARYANATPDPDQPLVKIAALKELLPSAREAGAVMDAPTSEVALAYTTLEQQPEDTLSEPQCIGAMFDGACPRSAAAAAAARSAAEPNLCAGSLAIALAITASHAGDSVGT